MVDEQNKAYPARIKRIKSLTEQGKGSVDYFEAGGLALTLLHDTVGSSHPLSGILESRLKANDWTGSRAASRSVVSLYEEGSLTSPRLQIAHEIEGSLLDIAQTQVQAAEKNDDTHPKHVQLAIAAFLAGAALEDALRRLCDAHGLKYDVSKTSISKLQAALHQPSQQITVISTSENKQITAWGDTRNKADHGRFSEITQAEVLAMVLGVRAFLDKHLP